MNTIKGRISIISVIILLVSITILTAINIEYLGNKVMDETKEELTAQANNYAQRVNSDILFEEGFLSSFKGQVCATGGEDYDSIQQVINVLYEERPNYMNIYFGTVTGDFIHADNGGTLPDDFDPRERDWYVQAVETNGVIITDPYVAKSTGELCATIAEPVYVQQEFKGVVGIDLPIDMMVSMVDNIDTHENAYGFLLDKDYNFITHPDEANQPTTTGSVSAAEKMPKVVEAIKEENYSIVRDNDYQGLDTFFSATPVGETGWYLVTAVPVSSARVSLHWSFINTAVVSLIVVIIAVLICLYVVRKEISPIDKMIPVANAISEGDLSVEISRTQKLDEVGTLQNSLADMVDNIKKIIEEQKLQLEDIADGNLAIPDMHEYPGEFNKIAEQINSIKATLNALIIEIQFASLNVQRTAMEYKLDADPEEIARIFDELSDQANELMEKTNMFITG